MKGRKILGLAILILGIGIFSYPMINEAYSKSQQAELKEAFDELLSEHLTQITPEVSATSGVLEEGDEAVDLPDILMPASKLVVHNAFPSLEYIELEEQDTIQDNQDVNNGKNRLNGQTLVGLIEINKIELIYAVVEGTKDWNLGVAIGHMKDTAMPGEIGNCVLAGHRGGISGPYFKRINELKKDDEIKVTTMTGETVTYQVVDSFVVKPTDVWVTESNPTEKMLTLITCQDNGTMRLIVQAICK